MANYFHFNNYDTLVNRFGNEDRANDIRGLKDWRTRIAALMDSFRSTDLPPQEKMKRENKQRTDLIEILNRDIKELRIDTKTQLYRGRLPEFYQEETTQQLILRVLLKELRAFPTFPADICPRIFISHRQADTKAALELAIHSQMVGFAYWIDVEDSHLADLEKELKKITEEESKKIRPLVTAAIIEMALINCTHIVAYLSDNSRGSLWIPYEYGRIKDAAFSFSRGCAWDTITPGKEEDFPDYMHMGIVCKREDEVQKWMAVEQASWPHKNCKPAPLKLFENQDFENWVKDILQEIKAEMLKKASQVAWTNTPLDSLPTPIEIIKRLSRQNL